MSGPTLDLSTHAFDVDSMAPQPCVDPRAQLLDVGAFYFDTHAPAVCVDGHGGPDMSTCAELQLNRSLSSITCPSNPPYELREELFHRDASARQNLDRPNLALHRLRLRSGEGRWGRELCGLAHRRVERVERLPRLFNLDLGSLVFARYGSREWIAVDGLGRTR